LNNVNTISILQHSTTCKIHINDTTHHFFRKACTKSGSLRFSQFSGCWLILSVYILMSFDFPFVRLFRVRKFCYYPYSECKKKIDCLSGIILSLIASTLDITALVM
jgi:hypothetical protein